MAGDTPSVQGTNGKEPRVVGWPDGITIRWKACPACGCVESFYDAITKGEATVQPMGSTMLFLLSMPYQTLLQPKEIVAFIDICPRCGTVFARGIAKRATAGILQGNQVN